MCLLRRPIAFLAPLAALLFALPAAAALEPVRRPISESGPAPIVRAGSLYVPPGHNKGRVSVVVRLHGAPLRRHIDADDVGAAAAYLLSDDAKNVTGTTLYVDSGYHAMGM